MTPRYKYIERSSAVIEQRTRGFGRSIPAIAQDTIWIVGVDPADIAPLVLDQTIEVIVENRAYKVNQMYQHPMQGWKAMLVPVT